ncbi:MAG: gliding motility protein GldN [Chitinophagales bacterium]
MRRIALFLLSTVYCLLAGAQAEPLDGYYTTTTTNSSDEFAIQRYPWQERDNSNKQPLEYQYQREADVMWSKNIWRVIDIREKMNLPFAYPPRPLIQILHESAKKGDITVYDPSVEYADQFKQVMSTTDVAKIGERIDTVYNINPVTFEEEMVVMKTEMTWEKITKYRVKEVWFFDTRTSSMQVRIIGLAPVMEYYDAAGNYLGDMTMYWIPYEELRTMLAKETVYNPQNDWQQFSWDDLFQMRRFESYIYKESNVYDRNINEYTAGIDAQVESERIKQELMEKEHDMWEY